MARAWTSSLHTLVRYDYQSIVLMFGIKDRGALTNLPREVSPAAVIRACVGAESMFDAFISLGREL
jgi:hypothetical protein